MKVFRPQNPAKALWLSTDAGPYFTNVLGTWYTMNEENNGSCRTEGQSDDYGKYNIPRDSEGNSVLTGDGAKIDEEFTVIGLEVYLIK